MRENNVKTIWKRGGAVINGWLGIPSSVAAENMAQAGWDALTVDLQHGLVDYQTAVTMLQAITTTATVPLCARAVARARHHHEAARRRRVRHRLPDDQHARRVRGASSAPVVTRRGATAASGRCARRGTAGADYFKHANDTVITMAMIETKQAVENLDEILSVPGLDSTLHRPQRSRDHAGLRAVGRADRSRSCSMRSRPSSLVRRSTASTPASTADRPPWRSR